jgi:hypothetical protein
MLFTNAGAEYEYDLNREGGYSAWESAMDRLNRYFPVNQTTQTLITLDDYAANYHPDMVLRSTYLDKLLPWDELFNKFLERENFTQLAQSYGVAIKNEATIVQSCPYTISDNPTRQELEVLSADGTIGCERYVELVRFEDTSQEASSITASLYVGITNLSLQNTIQRWFGQVPRE